MLHASKEGRADRAVFYNQEQRIVLSGGATMLQGENSLAGDNVTIYLRENRSVVTGGTVITSYSIHYTKLYDR